MTTPRRAMSPEPGHALRGGARRGLPPTPDPEREQRSAWLALAILAAVLVVAVIGLQLGLGQRTSASPSPTPAVTATPTTSSATPTTTPSTSPSPAPTGSPTSTSSPPAASPSPTPPRVLDLGDAVVTVPDGWEVYADELVQESRRLVRLRDPATDVRVQIVTLTTVTGELDQACRDLVADQRSAFTGVATSLVVDVPVGAGATAVSCAFTGTRVSDGVPNKTEFTLLRRDSDAQTLVFRDTIPLATGDDAPVLATLTGMECAAAESFGVVVQAC